MIHPFDGFEGIKRRQKGTVGVSAIVLALFLASQVFSRLFTSFSFQMTRTEKLNVPMILLQTLVPFLLFVVANWCLCTLIDGEGKFREIWIGVSYSLMPMILFTILTTILSNLFSLQEGFFITFLSAVGMLWFAFILFIGVMTVQQFTFKKTVISIGLTVVGMGVIIFLIILMYSLFQQLYIFLATIWRELSFRM